MIPTRGGRAGAPGLRLSSSAAGLGQGRPAPGRSAVAAGAVLGAALAVSPGALDLAAHALAAQTPKAVRETPSGQPVPRYVATKFATVNARGGPGDDFRLLWTYHARGLPLQIIAETPDWRRVCDPEGGVAWVHRRTVAETRVVLRTSPRPLEMRRRPSESSEAAAVLAGRAVAALKGCAKGWCRISADKAQGWVRQGEVWGTDEAPQCRVGPAAGEPGR